MKKLLVFDANSILNRAFYGVRPLVTKNGLHTNAVYGYLNIISKHLDAISPDFVAAAFDLKAPTFRHKMYAEYKAGRHKTPDELLEQIPYIKSVTEALGIKVLSLEGFEADDILGTLAKRFENEGHTYLVTGDRDSLQLVKSNTTVILATTGKDEEYTPEKVYERYLTTPEHLIDLKALMGDSSDNIPGVAGIGEKGAIKLISENVDIDTLYARLDNGEIKLTPSLEKKLLDGRESAFFSRTLATISKEVPLKETLFDITRAPIDKEELRKLFCELEFTKLSERYGLADTPISAPSEQLSFDTAETEAHDIKEASDEEFLGKNMLFLDFSPETKTFYRLSENGVISAPSSKALLEALSQKSLVLYDSKSFWHEVFDKGAEVSENAVKFDIRLAAYVENPDTRGDFIHIVMRTLSRPVSSFFAEDPARRAELIEPLYTALSKTLAEKGGERLFYDIELPLARTLARMEKIGFRLDSEALSAYGGELLEKMKTREEEIYAMTGERFNLNSPKQLGHILFEKMGLPVLKKKKTGYSTDAETLEKLRFHSPVVDYILEYRKLAKLHGTYVEGLLKVVGEDGRIRTDFKQTGTLTGRLSSAEPNMQNIPVKTEEGSVMRKFFTADENKVLIDADYSQIELRILAHMSGDEKMIEAFGSGRDFHSFSASQVFRVPIDEVTPALRSRAKAVNFGIVYGMGAFSLADDLHISMKEAKNYIDNYFATYKKVKEYLNKTVEGAKTLGYVETLFSRRRYIPELTGTKKQLHAFGERVAMNTPIQGTAADVIKLAMIKTDRRLEREGLHARLILQVHDELIIECPENEAEKALKILVEEMENAADFSVKLSVDAGIGKNWYSAKR